MTNKQSHNLQADNIEAAVKDTYKEMASEMDRLEKKIKDQIRTGASPRHVPAKILEVTDIPRTKSGKIVELAVRDIVHGRQIKNKEALANPEALDLFVNRPELRS